MALKLSKLNGTLISISILKLPNLIRSLKFLFCKIWLLNYWGKQSKQLSETALSPPPFSLSLDILHPPYAQAPPLVSPSIFPSAPTLPPLYPQFPHFNSLIELPFFAELLLTPSPLLKLSEPTPLKLRLLRILVNPVSYISCNKAELWDIIK